MSQPFSRYLHPFEEVRYPSLEPEVRRAILASWSAGRHRLENRRSIHLPPGLAAPVQPPEAAAGLRMINDGKHGAASLQ